MTYEFSDATPPEAAPHAPARLPLAEVRPIIETVRAWMSDSVKGRDDVIELVLVALFGDGHVLLEDFPGSGKTTLANALGRALREATEDALPTFRRVQFTPDLLPSDVTGVVVFDPEKNDFSFRAGPVFSYILLVDEINRTTPKVQSALLEAMAEKQVTVDNESHQLDDLFFVIATQNPLDAVGTYPLPVAQLDRFLFKIKMEHISRDAELDVLKTWGQPRQETVLPQITRQELLQARQAIRHDVHVAPAIHQALVDIARNLRSDSRVLQGASTRSLVLAIPALQTLAVLRGRDFVSPEDISALAEPIFRHRLELIPGVDDPAPVIADGIAGPLNVLASQALRGK